jgi:uncharacterized membrane protein
MKSFARGTAAVFTVLGIIVMLVGFSIAFSGLADVLKRQADPASPNMLSDLTLPMLSFQLIVGGAVGFQGLFLSAIGQVLWLLASIAESSEMRRDEADARLDRGDYRSRNANRSRIYRKRWSQD